MLLFFQRALKKMIPRSTLFTCLTLVISLIPATDYAATTAWPPTMAGEWQSVKGDYQNFYSLQRWTRLGIVFGVGGVMANTNADQEIQTWYQDNLRSSGSDKIASAVKGFGDWKLMLPVSLAAAGIGLVFPQDTGSTVGVWGERTLRAYVVAAPAMFFAQHLTGASRPGEREDASHWRPLKDDNGVSGHAFVGAVPFITIAQMTDSPLVRYASYAASVVAAWSRVNDNAHFTSQVLLGWYMGYEAVNAVSATSAKDNSSKPQVSVVPWEDGAELRLAYRW